MRTKTLLLTAALSAAGVATSMAQTEPVFSVNAVGYKKTPLTGAQFNLISNPLDAADNTIPALFAGVPAGTQVYKYDPVAGYTIWTFAGGPIGWSGTPAASTVEVNPGEGVFVRPPSNVELIFVGEVPQGELTQQVYGPGLSIQASQVPQSGRVATDLEMPVAVGDQVLRFINGAYVIKTFAGGPIGWSGGGDPGEPVIGLGEAFFVRKAGATATWTRNFDVNAE